MNSSSILCEYSDSESKVRMVYKCFQGNDSIAVHSFLHRVVRWAEVDWNNGYVEKEYKLRDSFTFRNISSVFYVVHAVQMREIHPTYKYHQ